jgi:K+ transporter
MHWLGVMVNGWLYPAIIGAGTLLADGIITPPISVTSAIEGLNLVPAFSNVIIPGNNLILIIVICHYYTAVLYFSSLVPR